MDEYRILRKWRVLHGYYRERECRGVVLQPTPQCVALMKRRGAAWKRLAVNEWGVLGDGGMEWETGDEVVAEVKIIDSGFWYFTLDPDRVGELRGGMTGEGAEEDVLLEYGVKQFRWEYILVARNGGNGRRLQLEEQSGRLRFEEAEETLVMGMPALRLVSVETVEAREVYGYQLRLVEWMPLGKRLLCKDVAHPRPGVFADAGEGCVRQVIYY